MDLAKSYKDIVFNSILTSFGLDALLFNNRRGGEVDTIHTVRDESIEGYANLKNQEDYDNRGEYDYHIYHDKNQNYVDRKNEFSKKRISGNLIDAYTGKKLDPRKSGDVDHIESAKTIHDDPGRVLAGISGDELANRSSNLVKTHRSINRSKGQKSTGEFADYLEENAAMRMEKITILEEKKKSGNLSIKDERDLEKYKQQNAVDVEKLRKTGEKVKKTNDAIINSTYYTSKKFFSETAFASTKMGVNMGVRQVTGLIIMDIWVIVEEELPIVLEEIKDDFSLESFFNEIKNLFQSAYAKVSDHWKEYIQTFKEGVLGGILASISSTAINMFTTTFTTAGRIIRQSWASFIEAVKILVVNPDRLPYGESLRAVFKIISTTASVIAGSILQEILSKKVSGLPASLQRAVPIFAGSLLSGLLSISLLYFFDYSKSVQRLVEFANNIRDEFDVKLDYYKEVVEKLTQFVASLENIDYESLEKEVNQFTDLINKLSEAENIEEENKILHKNLKLMNIDMPYSTKEERDAFMMDKSSVFTI